MRLSRRRKIVLGVVAGLLLVEVVTYCLFADRSRPVAAIRQLRDYRGGTFSFILVPHRVWESLTEGQQRALRVELFRHASVVYFSQAEVPRACKEIVPLTIERRKECEERLRSPSASPEQKVFIRETLDLGYVVTGYRDGICLQWRLGCHGPLWMIGCAQGYVSQLGAELRQDVYIWLFGWWVRVWNIDFAQA